MLQLSRMLGLLVIFQCHLVFGNPFSVKKVPVLGQLSAAKRAANLNYPEFPAQVKDRILGKRLAGIITTSISNSVRDWGLSQIGFFQVFTPMLKPITPGTASCSPRITVAVVDTGIDYTHPELVDSLWINQGETGSWTPPSGMERNCRNKSCNGIDDDLNGFVDDVAGWDFVNDVPLPYDTHGHGSHIAGIIGSSGNGGIGSPGVCPGVSIMALKYYDSSGVGYNNLQNTVRAFRYAIKMGAQIINYSGGGTDPAAAEKMVLEDARQQGILVVAAAGNEGQNNDVAPYFPASYGLDNIISVASVNQDKQLLPSSNWGPNRVHIAAPGHLIVSTLPKGSKGAMTGTSQATAFVTGAAALLASQLPSDGHFDYRKIKSWITSGATPLPGNSNKTLLMSGLLSVRGSLDQQRAELLKPSVRSVPVLALNPAARSESLLERLNAPGKAQ